MEKPKVGDKVYLKFDINWAGRSGEYTVASVGRTNIKVENDYLIDNRNRINFVEGTIQNSNYGLVGYVYTDANELKKKELCGKLKAKLVDILKCSKDISLEQIIEIFEIFSFDYLKEFPEIKEFLPETK